MELGKYTTTTQGYKNWGREVIYSEDELAAIKEAQALEDEKTKQGTLAALGANALRNNPTLVEANRDDFARSLFLVSSEGGASYADYAYHIAEGVVAMDYIRALFKQYPAMRNVVQEEIRSSLDNERKEAQ